MPRLIYIANVRFPSEKANAYQIVQMCEAFTQTGQDLTLVLPTRRNDQAEAEQIQDIWAYYGLQSRFEIRYLPCLDLIWRFNSQWAFWLQTFTFLLSLMFWLGRAEHYFTRDPFVAALLCWRVPRSKIIYEVHHKFRSQRGLRLQSWILRRVGKVVSLTGTMAKQLETLGAERVIIAHDGINPARFAGLPKQAELRAELGLEGYIACYAGRLHTMEMDKGLGLVVEAAKKVPDLTFLLLGGPPEGVEKLRQAWQAANLPPDRFCAMGSLPPTQVPRYLKAADVCLISSPHNEFFAHESSPMKLFEYMLAGRAIIASDLPSTREVVAHGESAYLISPSDVDALAEALNHLRDDPQLRQNLGENAQKIVMDYTWAARAERILGKK